MHGDVTERIAGGFPVRLRESVQTALRIVPEGPHSPTSNDVGPILLRGESVRIPSRVYFPVPAPSQTSGLSEVERRIVECIYTRHHDGRVRQRYLEAVLSADEAWVAPFVVQLLGEYLLEILQVLGRNDLRRPSIVAFAAENPAFMFLTRQRAISYWNCYHQHRFPKRRDYPAIRMLDALEDGVRSWVSPGDDR